MISLDSKKGILIKDNAFEIFFGNRHFTAQVESPPPHELYLLKQVHGCAVVAASPTIVEADGHWTAEPDQTLAIKTADCLPILFTSAKHLLVAALHAGWRGVEQKITSHFIQSCHLSSDTSLRMYIGPHIQQKSFEVDLDIAERILSAHSITLKKALADSLCVHSNNKYFISLSELVIREALKHGFSRSQIWVSDVDTKTDLDFFSYRRSLVSGETGVRNYSVVRRNSN